MINKTEADKANRQEKITLITIEVFWWIGLGLIALGTYRLSFPAMCIVVGSVLLLSATAALKGRT